MQTVQGFPLVSPILELFQKDKCKISYQNVFSENLMHELLLA